MPHRRTLPSTTPPAVTALTDDPSLLDQLDRLAAAAGAALHRLGAADPWPGSGLLLLGSDAARRASLRGSRRRPGLLVVTLDPPDLALWEATSALGAERLLHLPAHHVELAELVADAVEPAGRARVVGVLGGCGGAGASVLAAALATTAADAGHRVLLADLDPLGGGADVLVGADDLTGLRWGDLARARGRLPAASVPDLLPRLASLAVLGYERGAPVDLPPAAVEAVLRSASRGHDLVVLDLPRHDDLATARARALVDDLLVVVPARVRAVVATGQLLTALALTGAPGDAATPRLVARRAPRDPLPARA
ncbi:septum site-determining protein Ssd [Angustibacter aerolatus]